MALWPSEAQLNFKSFIVKLAKEVAEREIHNRPNWFTQSEKTLLHHLSLCNKPTNSLSTGTNKSSHKLKITQANLQKVKRCQNKHFKDDMKAAWDIVFQIIEGFDSHHSNYNPESFANKRSQIATKKSENAKILKTHFQKAFNNLTAIDLSIVEEMEQRPIAFNLECAPMSEEVRNAQKN